MQNLKPLLTCLIGRSRRNDLPGGGVKKGLLKLNINFLLRGVGPPSAPLSVRRGSAAAGAVLGRHLNPIQWRRGDEKRES